MMQKLIAFVIGSLFMVITTLTMANNNQPKNTLYQQALANYLAEPEEIAEPWILEKSSRDEARKVSIYTYTLTSQFWPKPNMSACGTFWKHTLVIYQPDAATSQQALLFVNNGTRNQLITDSTPHHHLDFARIASVTHSVVVDLQDVPNQFLTFDDDVPRKEDSIVAYTWNRFMDNPSEGYYWPVHLPMAKAIIKAMDAVQQIMQDQHQLKIDKFVVSGLSKRGLAAWLAALSDERINAIIPIVIDMLNMKDNLTLIYSSYNNHWPAAFHSYLDENIPARLHSPEFEQLMMIEDPLSYLTDANYQARLSIPKYIISASGDDFFVPDSLNLYLDKLPGETWVRVAPNQGHYIDLSLVEEAIISFYQTILHSSKRPTLSWEVKDGVITSVSADKQPNSIRYWEAVNPEHRDFRVASHISYQATELTGTCNEQQCHYPVTISLPKKGWKSSFVEATFHDEQGNAFTITTPAFVTTASS